MKYLIVTLTFCVHSVFAQQGIKGKVEWISGNQMPGPGKVATTPMPIVREIFVYQATTAREATNSGGVFYSAISTHLVTKIKSKKDGSFCVKLPPGKYSLFVKEDQGLFANSFDGTGCIQCITVEEGKFTTFEILVNYQAVY